MFLNISNSFIIVIYIEEQGVLVEVLNNNQNYQRPRFDGV